MPVWLRHALVLALVLAHHHAAWSCAVCVGNPTDPQSQGMQKAILGLLVITGGVLAGFAGFFVVLWRRAQRPQDPVAEYVGELKDQFRKKEVVL